MSHGGTAWDFPKVHRKQNYMRCPRGPRPFGQGLLLAVDPLAGQRVTLLIFLPAHATMPRLLTERGLWHVQRVIAHDVSLSRVKHAQIN